MGYTQYTVAWRRWPLQAVRLRWGSVIHAGKFRYAGQDIIRNEKMQQASLCLMCILHVSLQGSTCQLTKLQSRQNLQRSWSKTSIPQNSIAAPVVATSRATRSNWKITIWIRSSLAEMIVSSSREWDKGKLMKDIDSVNPNHSFWKAFGMIALVKEAIACSPFAFLGFLVQRN